MPVTISRSLIDRVARHKTRPGAQLPQLLHPAPVSSSRSSPGTFPPLPPPLRSPSTLVGHFPVVY